MAGIYNKWNYLPEKSKALAAWARYLELLVSGEPRVTSSSCTVPEGTCHA